MKKNSFNYSLEFNSVDNFERGKKLEENRVRYSNAGFLNEFFHSNQDDEQSFNLKIDGKEFDDNLLLINLQQIEKRDFFSDIRARLDLDHYLKDIVILNVNEANSYRTILQDLLCEMLKNEKIHLDNLDIQSNFFIDRLEIDLTNKIQAVHLNEEGKYQYDQNWVCAIGTTSKLKRKKIGLAILSNKANLGSNANEIQFILLIMSPKREKATKNSYETAKTFVTLFTSKLFREKLLKLQDRNKIIVLIEEYWEKLTNECKANQKSNYVNEYFDPKTYLSPGLGLFYDIKKRYSVYASDFLDGFRKEKTFYKTIATTLFLYFSIILPAIAFGVLNTSNTNGKMNTSRALVGQAIGGIFYAFFSGQHMIVLGTTALVSLYTKVVYELSQELEVDFYAMYACVGLWSTLFLLIYSFLGLSYLIKYCTRSVEEIFAMFIVICFIKDALKDTVYNVQSYYLSDACGNSSLVNNVNNLNVSIKPCEPENTLLFIILMFGTLWLALKIYAFNRTQFFTEKQRDLISSYALPISVVMFTLVSLYIFQKINVEKFDYEILTNLTRAKIENLSPKCISISCGLGFALSILFFMDQNITGQIVNSPTNNMKKGPAPHLDIFILSILNGFLSIFALPWMHGILPQSPLHVILMADTEEKFIENRFERSLTNVRETRITSIFCNLLILVSFYFAPGKLKLIPVPVLDGLFLYCAITSLTGNSFFERILLVITEQVKYPVKHYTRRCPQKKMHFFTLLQFLQLILVACVGYAPSVYIQMAFPIMIALLIPIRHIIIPLFIKTKYLKALEAYD